MPEAGGNALSSTGSSSSGSSSSVPTPSVPTPSASAPARDELPQNVPQNPQFSERSRHPQHAEHSRHPQHPPTAGLVPAARQPLDDRPTGTSSLDGPADRRQVHRYAGAAVMGALLN
nr:hypothetical protein [Micromonospora sp. DSM 115978]